VFKGELGFVTYPTPLLLLFVMCALQIVHAVVEEDPLYWLQVVVSFFVYWNYLTFAALSPWYRKWFPRFGFKVLGLSFFVGVILLNVLIYKVDYNFETAGSQLMALDFAIVLVEATLVAEIVSVFAHRVFYDPYGFHPTVPALPALKRAALDTDIAFD
jgi:hypothetical protein